MIQLLTLLVRFEEECRILLKYGVDRAIFGVMCANNLRSICIKILTLCLFVCVGLQLKNAKIDNFSINIWHFNF